MILFFDVASGRLVGVLSEQDAARVLFAEADMLCLLSAAEDA